MPAACPALRVKLKRCGACGKVSARKCGKQALKTSIAALAAVEAEVAVDDAMADDIMGDNMGVAADAMDVGV